jgi:hypothetical protein
MRVLGRDGWTAILDAAVRETPGARTRIESLR